MQATYRTEGWGGDEISGVHNNPGEGGWKTRIRTGIGGQEKKAAYFRILKKANSIFLEKIWQRSTHRQRGNAGSSGIPPAGIQCTSGIG